MCSTTNFRRTQIRVTKIIRLTIETGSVTGIYYAPQGATGMKKNDIGSIKKIRALALDLPTST